MNHLSYHDKALARDAHVEALADILMENRHQVPKKPIYVTHLRNLQWYKDLFKLTASLNHEKANRVYDRFKDKLVEMEKLTEMENANHEN